MLATLSPYMIRLSTHTVAQVGRASGFIIAASTLGSIAGVFVSGFVLIDHVKVSSIFRAMGILTLLLAIPCFALDSWFAPPRLASAIEKEAAG
jgi:predicted MFS family arabinose efflux permease